MRNHLLLFALCGIATTFTHPLDPLLMAVPTVDPVEDRSFLSGIISRTYGGNIRNSLLILDYIERFPMKNHQIIAYRLLFDEMMKHKDLYSPELMLLAYRIHTKFNENTSDEDLKHIRAHLPSSVLNFPWSKELRIQNVKHKEFVYSPYDKFVKDAKNRRMLTWRKTDDCNDNTCKWRIKMRDGLPLGFNLWNVERNELMYAADNSMLQDSDRRNVYGWREKAFNLPGGDMWMFEPIDGSDSFRIYNMYYGEYLYSPYDKFKIDDDRRPLFTWRRLGCDGDACEFKIIPA